MVRGQTVSLPMPSMLTVSLPDVNSLPAVTRNKLGLQLASPACSCCSPGVVLPWRVTDLTAQRANGTTVALSWRVEASDEDFRWTLERRLDSEPDFSGRREWSEEVILRRKYLDHNDYPGASYYRLRGVTVEGIVEFTRIGAIGHAFVQPGVSVYPKPMRGPATAICSRAPPPPSLTGGFRAASFY